jgi:hypothetical protein
MPIVFAHSERLRLRTATYFGVIDDNTVLRAYRAVANGYDPSLDNVIDLAGVTSVLISEAVFDELATLFDDARTAGNRSRLAVVTLADVTEDISRLLRALHPAEDIHVCRSLVEAHRWLTGEKDDSTAP